MQWDEETLNRVYEKTQGRCHLCEKKIAWKNYGRPGERGAWEVDHSVPRAAGGSDHGNNLWPSCTSCNRSKQDRSTKSARTDNGMTRAPMSESEEAKARGNNAAGGVVLGATALGVLGGALRGAPLGVLGVIAGGVIGGIIGHSIDPEG